METRYQVQESVMPTDQLVQMDIDYLTLPPVVRDQCTQ